MAVPMVAEPSDLTTLHVRRAVAGDSDSRAFLIEKFTPLLLVQARYRLVGAAARHCEPEDLVQETWAITLPRLQDLRAREERLTPVLLKFLATTLLRCATQVLRKHVLRRPPAASLGGSDDSTTADPVAALADDVSGVVTRLCRRDRTDALQAAIAGLPREEQEVLVLRGIEQHANREVAQMLGIDDSSVTRRYQKALTALRSSLPDSIVDELE